MNIFSRKFSSKFTTNKAMVYMHIRLCRPILSSCESLSCWRRLCVADYRQT